jgi:hypothetical protein
MQILHRVALVHLEFLQTRASAQLLQVGQVIAVPDHQICESTGQVVQILRKAMVEFEAHGGT